MRRPRSTCSSAAAIIAIAVLGASADARAQACCAGGTALSPGRLNLHEDALAGVQTKVTAITGTYDAAGRFTASPRGTAEVDLEQDLVATLRVLSRGQFSVIAPIVETYRKVPGLSAAGGGFGDLQVAARWDATIAGTSLTIPGIALLASLAIPTGVAPELASHALATDATGTGAIQGAFGLSLEQTFGKVLVNVTGSATLHSTRMVAGQSARLGPAFMGFAALGYSFDAGPVAALTASYTAELENDLDGMKVPGSERALLRLGVSGGYAFNDAWRIQGGVFGDVPAKHGGMNQPAGAGGTVTLMRVW